MNNYRQAYEAPETIVIVVNTENGILTVSGEGTNASRNSYGTAEPENWD